MPVERRPVTSLLRDDCNSSVTFGGLNGLSNGTLIYVKVLKPTRHYCFTSLQAVLPYPAFPA